MKFRIVWVGKTRNPNLKALQETYLERLSRFVECGITEVREQRGSDAVNEEKRMLDVIDAKTYTVLLDATGQQLSSSELAGLVEAWQRQGRKQVTFVIGGANGVSPQVAERADHRLSLSILTFTHEMARVILLEQLYRAFTIIKGFPYQK